MRRSDVYLWIGSAVIVFLLIVGGPCGCGPRKAYGRAYFFHNIGEPVPDGYDLIVTNVQNNVDSLQSAHPDVTFLSYWNSMQVANPAAPNVYRDEILRKMDPWLVKDENGDYVSDPPNLAALLRYDDPAGFEFYAHLIFERTGGRGIYLDNCFGRTPNRIQDALTEYVGDDSVTVVTDWLLCRTTLITTLRTLFGKDYILVGNTAYPSIGLEDEPWLNGVTVEGRHIDNETMRQEVEEDMKSYLRIGYGIPWSVRWDWEDAGLIGNVWSREGDVIP